MFKFHKLHLRSCWLSIEEICAELQEAGVASSNVDIHIYLDEYRR